VDKVLLIAERGDERFEIVDDGGGAGLLVFRYASGHNTHDYLQDDVPMCQRCAEAEWGLAPSAWRVAEPGERPLWQRQAEPGAAADPARKAGPRR
jgi:hypothetical protein